jgi:hypothetical protein
MRPLNVFNKKTSPAPLRLRACPANCGEFNNPSPFCENQRLLRETLSQYPTLYSPP